MKFLDHSRTVICFLIQVCLASSIHAQGSLRGVVRDASDHSVLPGAILYLPDMRYGVAADENGAYKISNIPPRSFLVQVKMTGYASALKTVDFAHDSVMDFELSSVQIEAREVIITGSAFTGANERSSVPVVPLERKEVNSLASGNIVSALAQVPGVSGISSGGSIAKPVIRGLGYNRIVTINEGLRQEGQQWGDEHGLEIDQFAADRIEILKGPSSLLYGSDALGGVINILEPIPSPEGCTHGTFDLQATDNNAMMTGSLMLEGNHKGFVWSGRGTMRSAAAYRTPVERVYNSAFSEQDANLMLGLNRKWGYSHAHFSIYESKPGLISGDRDSATGNFIDANGLVVSDKDAFQRDVNLPFQRIGHLKVSSVNSFFIGKGNLRVILGHQQNKRREYEESSSEPGLSFLLNTNSADVKYYFPEVENFETVVGFSGLIQQNDNQGDEFLIPDYLLRDGGIFVSSRKNFKQYSLNAGLRVDQRMVQGNALMDDSVLRFAAFRSVFEAWSGSLGLAYEFSDQLNMKANIGRGFRAPNISELAANGMHEGTFRYEIGNAGLHPETSMQLDMGVEWKQEKFSTGLSFFYNNIRNFIYYRNLNQERMLNGEDSVQVFRYIQGEALLYGMELSCDWHPVKGLHVENALSFVQAQNKSLNKPLPFTPPLHWRSVLRYEYETKAKHWYREPSCALGFDYYAAQDRIDAFESRTEAAWVFNLTLSSGVKVGKDWADVFLRINNLGDRVWYNHLSRLKELAIAEQGRSITLGCTIPFGIRHVH